MNKAGHTSPEGEFLRVIMVTPGYYPIKGGTETIVRNLSILLNRMGVHTDVMTFNMDRKWNPKWSGSIERTDGITVFKVPALNWLPIEHSPRITLGVNLIPGRFTKILKQYDAIHFHEVDFSFPLFSVFVRRPKILHLHGISVEFFKRYRPSRSIFKHVADFYISITRQMESDLAELGFPREKVFYLPNGVDIELFRPQGEKEDNLLLFVGSITWYKGLRVLLESLRYLEKSVRLAVIGPAGYGSRYYQQMLELMEKENRRNKHEINYLGAMDQVEIIKWYQKASILILPSFIDAFPVVTLEALSCQTPVIATPVGGISEIVRNYEHGILVPPNNPQKLAEAIDYLLENRDVRIRLGQEGRRWVIMNFSLEAITKKLCNIYQKVTNP